MRLRANEADKAIATKEVNDAVEPMFQQGQQVNEANGATADTSNEAIGADVSVKAVDSDDEDGLDKAAINASIATLPSLIRPL
jgi:hypothetical protein